MAASVTDLASDCGIDQDTACFPNDRKVINHAPTPREGFCASQDAEGSAHGSRHPAVGFP